MVINMDNIEIGLEEEVIEKLKLIAKEQDMSIEDVVMLVINNYLHEKEALNESENNCM